MSVAPPAAEVPYTGLVGPLSATTVHEDDSPYQSGTCQDRVAAVCRGGCNRRYVYCCPSAATFKAMTRGGYQCPACTKGGAAC